MPDHESGHTPFTKSREEAATKFNWSIGLAVTTKDLKIILGFIVMVVAMVYGYPII